MTSQILVSPPGYDDVNFVLQQLGGSPANTRQLAETEMHLLRDTSFLEQFEHLFLNCHGAFHSDPDPAMAVAIRDYVENGHALYASDWASRLIETAFAGRISFKRDPLPAGTLKARVQDSYLVRKIGRSIEIRFDLDSWHLIDMYPASADVLLEDEHSQPLAIGFRAGRGRVVFTSFHHHAQLDNAHRASSEETAFLEWLVTVPTVHPALMVASTKLVGKRATQATTHSIGLLGKHPHRIPLPVTPGPGLRVIVLAWNAVEELTLSLRHLRGENVLASETSSQSPLVLQVKNTAVEDVLEISQSSTEGQPDQNHTMHSYVLASGVRHNLVGNTEWFALAIARHLQATLRESRCGESIEPIRLPTLVRITRKILTGLGYTVRALYENHPMTTAAELIADAPENGQRVADISVQLQIIERPVIEQSTDRPYDEYPDWQSCDEKITVETERILVRLVRSTERSLELTHPGHLQSATASMLTMAEWELAGSIDVADDFGDEIVSVEQLASSRRMTVLVYQGKDRGP